MYRLMAIDMDGTLLQNDKSLLDATRDSIKKAMDLGIKIVLTSGRPVQGIKNYLDKLGLNGKDDYVIGLNGAVICRCSDYSVVSSSAVLTGKDLKYIYTRTKELGAYVHAFTEKEDFVSELSKLSEAEEKRLNLKVRKVDFLKEINDNDEIHKVVLEEESDVLDRIMNEIPEDLKEEYSVIRTVGYMIEFMNKDCNKALGVESLAKYLGISREEIIAIGDADNDIEMLQYAGLGVAMGNAEDRIKALAKFVTKSNEEDGVSYVIEKFILNQNS
ncbi:Cof-type HAD-IIB family hydrolase [Clostridium folliculivorans]|uniref:Haloacid dehalogenase n=1 Tax=Clostridium folliculivorans TaxID=2886038 RepID=A0A9W6DBF7_9CLOT|nr:Cof-type HAD-IIB family hydrolase [Clostridium folliculivorans]GKU26219.1 haloacid dehalogenase [Clostridium folliculivorans]GKU31891.1 haloacid dehalogenase [Clostridium folliculivorans]